MEKLNINQIAEKLSILSQHALIIEVSSEKPGNVSPQRDFCDMTYEDFVLSCIITGSGLKECFEGGLMWKQGKISAPGLCIGRKIYEIITNIKSSVGVNTQLGTVMLAVPTAAGIGSLVSNGNLNFGDNFENLKNNINKIIKSASVEDTLYLYDAINIACAGGLDVDLDSFACLDLGDESAKEKIIDREISFYDIMKISAGWDGIAGELSNGMPSVFDAAGRILKLQKQGHSLRLCALDAYLYTLAKHPDTLIARKHGVEISVDISKYVSDILDRAGESPMLNSQDIELIEKRLSGKNPGTTADIVAAALIIAVCKLKF